MLELGFSDYKVIWEDASYAVISVRNSKFVLDKILLKLCK